MEVVLIKDSLCIMGILIDKRTKCIPQVQDVLTKYGDFIITRVGSHDPGEEQHGLITLNVRGDIREVEKLELELAELDGVQVGKLVMKQ